MARIELKKMYPFTRFENGRGYTDDSVYGVLELETAPTKAGMMPYRLRFSWGRHEACEMTIDDALERFNNEMREFARQSGWTPEGER